MYSAEVYLQFHLAENHLAVETGNICRIFLTYSWFLLIFSNLPANSSSVLSFNYSLVWFSFALEGMLKTAIAKAERNWKKYVKLDAYVKVVSNKHYSLLGFFSTQRKLTVPVSTIARKLLLLSSHS